MGQISECILIKFINNTCSDKELLAVKEWLDESDENVVELLELERMSSLASALRDDSETRRRMREKIQTRIDNAGAIKRYRTGRFIMRWTASVAAMVAILFTAGYFVLREPQVKMMRVAALSESRCVMLPDSSIVYLNVNSELKYPVQFADDMRRVELIGEGYFEVKSNRSKPFVVEGEYLDVTVLGTQFNFISRQGQISSVSLKEGLVEVSSSDGDEGVALIPGQKASYDLNTGLLTVSETKAAVDAAWHDNIIPFEKASMSDIRDILQQLYNVEIKLDSSLDLNKTYSGVTVYFDEIDSTLNRLSHTLPITYTKSNNTITISTKKK